MVRRRAGLRLGRIDQEDHRNAHTDGRTRKTGNGSAAGSDCAQAADRKPATVIAYPLFSGGERFPFTEPDAEGFVLGVPTGEIDLYAALLQGVAFVERRCFDLLDMLGAPVGGDLIFTGGATRSRYWCQLRADILGWPPFAYRRIQNPRWASPCSQPPRGETPLNGASPRWPVKWSAFATWSLLGRTVSLVFTNRICG